MRGHSTEVPLLSVGRVEKRCIECASLLPLQTSTQTAAAASTTRKCRHSSVDILTADLTAATIGTADAELVAAVLPTSSQSALVEKHASALEAAIGRRCLHLRHHRHRAAAVVCDAAINSVGRVETLCVVTRRRCHCCQSVASRSVASSVRLSCRCRHQHRQLPPPPPPANVATALSTSSPPTSLPQPSALLTLSWSLQCCRRRVSLLWSRSMHLLSKQPSAAAASTSVTTATVPLLLSVMPPSTQSVASRRFAWPLDRGATAVSRSRREG